MLHPVAAHFGIAHGRDRGARHRDANVSAKPNTPIRPSDRDVIRAIARALADILGPSRRDGERCQRDDAKSAPNKQTVAAADDV
ncbi:MAG: hypothetical protein AB7F41_06200 [Methylocystis sp.]|uniref:hypothetical protein n=1 Tax=Methylocystis sp. TaxID=1911079 RepID=UPI003D0A5682